DKKAQTQDLSTISYVSYKGVTFTKEQCLYIFAKAIDMKNQGISGNIYFKSFNRPDSPLNSISTYHLTKSEYVDMSRRTYKWMDNYGRAPNYTGVVASGSPDFGYDYLVATFALVIIDSKNGSLVPTINLT
ncbi:MAG: pseudomurein-binding repeat-containing protein, partial [Methanobacteriaceae archaeon]